MHQSTRTPPEATRLKPWPFCNIYHHAEVRVIVSISGYYYVFPALAVCFEKCNLSQWCQFFLHLRGKWAVTRRSWWIFSLFWLFLEKSHIFINAVRLYIISQQDKCTFCVSICFIMSVNLYILMWGVSERAQSASHSSSKGLSMLQKVCATEDKSVCSERPFKNHSGYPAKRNDGMLVSLRTTSPRAVRVVLALWSWSYLRSNGEDGARLYVREVTEILVWESKKKTAFIPAQTGPINAQTGLGCWIVSFITLE